MRTCLPLPLTVGCIALLGALAGCSVVVDGTLASKDGDCQSAEDGAACGDGQVCRGGACVASECGDGVVDEGAGEECDDGDLESGDGCQPDCSFTCTSDAACDDGEACNGAETCDLATNACVSASQDLDDGTACMLDEPASTDGGVGDPTVGQCRAGACVPAGCGNGVVGDGEECDDGNEVDGDGCDVDCTFSCLTDEDCQNETVCDGIETCDVATNACESGAAPDCTDTETTMNEFGTWGSECTVDTCDPATGCVNTLRDEDGDGYPPASYTVDGTTFTCAGTANNDCNDIDDTVFPGAEEICDGRDNNCQSGADETAPTWFADCDGDGFASLASATFTGCTPPSATGCPGSSASADWTTLRPVSGNRATYDCNDANDEVYPGQTMYRLAIPAPGSGYDWNCNGTWEQESPDPTPCTGMFCPALRVCQDLFGRCSGTGRWDDRSAPACGRTEDYAYCETLRGGGCGLVPRSRTQRCR